MLTIIPCWKGDTHRVENLLKWISELGGCPNHDLLIVSTPSADIDTLIEAAKGWRKVTPYKTHDEWVGHPFGANRLFQHAVRYVEHFKLGPFLWLEPDAIPLKEGWLDSLEAEYKASRKVFMGHHSRKDGEAPHMNGVGIWNRVSELAPTSMSIPDKVFAAFDVEAGPEMIPHLHETRLIQFEYKKEEERLQDRTLSWLREDAVLWHTDKTHGLIDLLREKRAGRGAEVASRVVVKDVAHPVCGNSVEVRHPLIEFLPLPNVIYGFYGEVPEIQREETMALAELWRERWTLAGWIPIILGPEHAENHPLYSELASKFAAHPTINPKDYEFWCYVRWLAVAQVGGGVMSDFDVIPNGFAPRKIQEHIVIHQHHNPCPCLVSGSAKAFEQMAVNLAAYDSTGRQHVSDQDIIQEKWQEWGIEMRNEVKHFSAEGWEKAPAIHFCNAVTVDYRPRSLHIPLLLPRKLNRAEVLERARAVLKEKREKEREKV